MSSIKNAFTHYTSPLGNDCYSPNFNSSVSKVTVWNKLYSNKYEITVEYIDGQIKYYRYSEFEAVLNAVYEGEDEDE